MRLHTASFVSGMQTASNGIRRFAETCRLLAFIEACRDKGVITNRQWEALQGVTTDTPPRRVLHILTRKH
jgi:hypothetical protein